MKENRGKNKSAREFTHSGAVKLLLIADTVETCRYGEEAVAV